MTSKSVVIPAVSFTVILLSSCTQQDDFPLLKGEYLGQKPPGMTPEIFAPGTVSEGRDESSAVFSPDGKEFFYTTKLGPQKRHTVMVSKVMNGTWTKPDIASFSGQYSGSRLESLSL